MVAFGKDEQGVQSQFGKHVRVLVERQVHAQVVLSPRPEDRDRQGSGHELPHFDGLVEVVGNEVAD